ncbi:hypothetical protein [Pseudomonas sp. 5P_5.1_Bac1]|uniref:hypothetical protein n=1 Tax=Pseudomonas sp. 5P_5.1_Bac1 TaxID=2971616 RepID=UPI0021C7FDEC|nr:hypothetical protein [Pseudomonas sp. 5P_5.1_Bac1]MCU1723744.1 hypothetical protein [Pseudomonas sp. 5P_5.1_Bac1]
MSGLAFSIANSDGKPVVYLGQTQTLTLTVSNTSGADMALAGSLPVPEDDANGNTALLYLFLANLVADPASVQVTCASWRVQFQNTAQGPVWCLALEAGMTFKAGASIAVSLAGLSVSGLPGARQLGIDAYLADGDAVQLPVLAQNDPGKLLPLNIDFAVTGGNSVYITENINAPMASSLVFRLSNPSPNTPIVPADVSWGSKTPSFTLSFAYASKGGAGALTSAEKAIAFTRGTVQDYGNLWSISANTQGTPSWTLTPDQLKNKQILGTGDAASFEFILGNIITQLDVGTTLAYLQWSNIPGYQDGYKTLALVKVKPQPGILRLISLSPSVIKQGTPVQLVWETFALTRQTLSWAKNGTPYSVAVPASASAYSPDPQPDDTVTYTLDGYDSKGAKVASQQQTITVIANAPVISGFTVDPQVAAFEGANPNVPVKCKWTVTDAVSQAVNNTVGVSPLGITLDSAGTVNLLVTGHQNLQASASQQVYSVPGYVQTFVSTSQVSGGSGGPKINNVLSFNRVRNIGTWELNRSDSLSSRIIASQGFSWSTDGLNVYLTFNDKTTTATLACTYGALTLSQRSGKADSHGLQPLAMLVQNAGGQNSPVFSAQTVAV